jgi:hypothetical protein
LWECGLNQKSNLQTNKKKVLSNFVCFFAGARGRIPCTAASLLALLLAPAVAQHTPIPQAFADR